MNPTRRLIGNRNLTKNYHDDSTALGTLPHLCYLGLGSNLHSPQRQLMQALRELRAIPRTQLIKISPFYANPPLGFGFQPHFMNAVIAVKTTLTPHQLLDACQAIEAKLGRVRKKPWGPRTLDLDVLLYGHRRMQTHRLILPHPEMMQRDFVLWPLQHIIA